MISRWTLKDGVAHTEDVAAATRKNRLAARGKVDYAARRFAGLNIAMLDKRGCAVFEQAVTGSFDDPQVTEANPVETILGPLIDLVEKGIDQLTGHKSCRAGGAAGALPGGSRRRRRRPGSSGIGA